MKRSRRQVVNVLRCKDGVAVPIKQPRVVAAIRDRDTRIAQLEDRLQQPRVTAGDEARHRRRLLENGWVRLGIWLRLVAP